MNNPEEDIQYVAELVGMTSGHLKKIDGEIVSTSANLQQSQQAWNPHSVVKSHAAQVLQQPRQPSLHQAQPQQGIPEEVIQQMEAPPAIPAAAPVEQPVPAQVHTQVVAQSDPNIEKRLADIESKLDTIVSMLDDITAMDKKLNSFVDRGLKDKVKQITLKLDGSSTTK